MTDLKSLRTIKSFVRREGRITAAQEKAFQTYWDRFGISTEQIPIQWQHLFNRDHKRSLEIGFGMGDALFQHAKNHPDEDFVGIEVYKPGVGRLLHQLGTHDLNNVKIIHGDAVEWLENYLPQHSFDQIFILYPDPWHKKRHHKRRLIQITFILSLLKVLKRTGNLIVVTDNASYAEHIQAVLQTVNSLSIIEFPANLEYPKTKYAQRAEKLSHQIWPMVYQKISG